MLKRRFVILVLVLGFFVLLGTNVSAKVISCSSSTNPQTKDVTKVCYTDKKVSYGKLYKKTYKKWYMEKGTSKVLKQGRKAFNLYKYQVTYVNGVLKSTKQISKVKYKAITRKVARGVGAKTKDFERLAKCESGGRWSVNTGNGYYGGLQFSHTTWVNVRSKSGSKANNAHSASKSRQIKAARWLQYKSGWGQWPHCSSKLGLK